MSVNTDAILAYGYNIGALYDHDLEWYNEDEGDFEARANDYLLDKIVGFTEKKWQVEGYWDRRAHANAELGLAISTHCSCDYPMYALVIPESVYIAARGEVVKIDHIDSLETPYGWHDRVVKGMEVLGIEPDGPPSWLLYSLWC